MTDERPQAVSFAELKTDYGIRFSSRWIRELCKAGQFPKPLRLTANRVAWLKSEVEDWLRTRQHSGTSPSRRLRTRLRGFWKPGRVAAPPSRSRLYARVRGACLDDLSTGAANERDAPPRRRFCTRA
jgi:hypothetical protein